MPTVRGSPTQVGKDRSGLWALFESRGAPPMKLVVRILEANLVRVSLGDPETEEKRTWMVVDRSGDVPLEGKEKTDESRFSCPPGIEIVESVDGCWELKSSQMIVKVFMKEDLRIEIFDQDAGLFFADAAFDAYQYGETGGNVFRHTIKCDLKTEEYVGFGETSGALRKNGTRIRVDAKDAMGYDAETSDPLYKHWPYHMTIVDRPGSAVFCYGLLYDTMRRSVFDLGKEISAFRGSYRYFETDPAEKGLDYYVFGGATPATVSQTLVHLIGSPTLPPLWAMGYLGSSMAYTESENAQERLDEYLGLLRRHQIPCDGFHLSSGYTTDSAGRRCVFTWNRSRIPDPQVMFDRFNAQRVNVIANVKPWLLKEHPAFREAAANKLFFRSAQNPSEPSYGRFWVGGAGTSGLGCYFDFTSREAFDWWKRNATDSLLRFGCRALWNDNNEYEVDESRAVTAGGETVNACGRALHTLLMARASRDALREYYDNDEEVMVVSRSGSIGTHRYAAQTWSGDNSTSWKTLKFNIAMCLSLGLSGWPGSGPDVGGFAGEKPSPELFLRWVQSGVLMPRFSIHSSVWKTSSSSSQTNETASTNEPWMYPETTDAVRRSIQLRYRLKPWIHSLYIEASQSGAPVARPLMFHYPQDKAARAQSFQFLLGRDVLVAPIYEPGVTSVWDVYLPQGDVWVDLEGQVYEGGGIVSVPVQGSDSLFAGAVVLIRRGGGIVLASSGFSEDTAGKRHPGEDQRNIYLVLDDNGEAVVEWFDRPSVKCIVRCTKLDSNRPSISCKLSVEEVQQSSKRAEAASAKKTKTGLELGLSFNLERVHVYCYRCANRKALRLDAVDCTLSMV